MRLASDKMASLTRLKNISRQNEFDEAWLPEHHEAFADVKAAIATATLLVHPQPDAPTEIWCDASNIAVGGVLVQLPTRNLATAELLEQATQ